jgi:hypothetical protein
MLLSLCIRMGATSPIGCCRGRAEAVVALPTVMAPQAANGFAGREAPWLVLGLVHVFVAGICIGVYVCMRPSLMMFFFLQGLRSLASHETVGSIPPSLSSSCALQRNVVRLLGI